MEGGVGMAGASEGGTMAWRGNGSRIHGFPYKAFKRAAVGSQWAEPSRQGQGTRGALCQLPSCAPWHPSPPAAAGLLELSDTSGLMDSPGQSILPSSSIKQSKVTSVSSMGG